MKKIISILLVLLTFSHILSVIANEQVILKSKELSVGFGKDGQLLQTLNSKYLSVGISNPSPSLLSSDPESLPPVEGVREVTLYGGNFVDGTKVFLEDFTAKKELETEIKSPNELVVKVPITNNEITKNNLSLFAKTKKAFEEGELESNKITIPLDYSIPLLTSKNGQPLVNITPSIGVAPQVITFDASKVINPDDIYLTNPEGLTYEWDFGDVIAGSTEGATKLPQTDPVSTYKYTTPGKYTVTLEVTNANGKSAKLEKEIEIRDKNEAPAGTFNVSKTIGDIPLEITFDAMVTDEENDEISYVWNFGDGAVSKTGTHTYVVPGTYVPRLTVTDTLGAKTDILGPSLIILPKNNLPVAKIAAIPDQSILSLMDSGLFTSKVQFLSADTRDPDEENLSYLWSFGDGNESTEQNPKHEYQKEGTYTVNLTVTDVRGGKDIKETTVTISKPKPIALAIVNETTGTAPFEVSFDGLVSQDFDGMAVTLNWDFGDGIKETTDSTNSVIMHTYENPGAYLVTLTATTPDNRFHIINPANIIVSQSNKLIGQVSLIEGSPEGVLGNSKIKLSAKGSYDPLDGNAVLKYSWSWNAYTWDVNGNLVDISDAVNEELRDPTSDLRNNEIEFSYTFTQAGQYTPILEIEKEDGNKSRFLGETITISSSQAPVAVARIISEKTESEPGLEINFDGSGSYDPKGNNNLQFVTWNFGDGEKSSEVSPKHTFNTEGTFTPVLVVVDNEGQIGFAQTSSIKISSKPTESTTLSRKLLKQMLEEKPTTEELNNLVDSMINEAINLFSSNDNEKPQIGPITLEPKSARPGDVLKLNCFVRDNVAVSSFGYALIDKDGKVISQKSVSLINQDDSQILHDEHYLQEEIIIPDNALPGEYRLKLTASDTAGNQIAPLVENNSSGEEITVKFEVVSNLEPDSIISTPYSIIEPSIVTEVSDSIRLSAFRKRELPDAAYRSSDLRFQSTSFTVTDLGTVFNPYLSLFPSATNTLYLGLNSTNEGYFTIGTRGSLAKDYFREWDTTKIYVNFQYIGTINWYDAAKISFTNNVTSQNIHVQFRPTDNKGVELPSDTWTQNFFTFIVKPPPPEITSITPSERISGRGSFDLGVYGNNFDTSSKIYFNGNPVTPYISDSTRLIAAIPADYVKDIGFRTVQVKNANSKESNITYFTSKVNPDVLNICSSNNSLPQTYTGADRRTRLSGNNTYLSDSSATIEGNGSVNIPFCLGSASEVKTNVNVLHLPNISTKCNHVSFRLDDTYIGSKTFCGSGAFDFENLSNNSLNPGIHNLGISFSSTGTDKLIVEKASFINGGGPELFTISPLSVGLEGITRPIKLYGANFDPSSKVYIDGIERKIKNISNAEIEVELPEKFNSYGLKSVYVVSNNQNSRILSLYVKDRLELISDSFKVDPIQPFPGNSFDVELKVKSNLEGNYLAKIAVYDPDGKLLSIPNVSDNISTINLLGNKELNGEISFKGKIPFAINSKPGNYQVVASVERKAGTETDYSDIEAFKYITAAALKLGANDYLVPGSHKLTFTPKPAVVVAFGIEENNFENIGFTRVGNKVIQDSQSVTYKAEIQTGKEHAANIKFNFKSGDDRESGITGSNNATYTYENKDISSTAPKTFRPKLEVFWIENGIQTQISTPDAPTISVYPNYKPVAKARVFTEQYPTYSGSPPLMTAFIDTGSYDPNERFSKVIDYVDSLNNIWTLFKGTVGQDENIISTPIDSSISSDRKTFLSGNLFTPGTYFAKLIVKDRTGQTDTASTESVTVTLPHQKIIVFATTDPQDNKIIDPITAKTPDGVPVKFMSSVKVLTGNPVLTYKWDFGDSSCHSSKSGNPGGVQLPVDCTSPNPTHYYFDGKSSFNGISFLDRKSVTPKLRVTANFPNGYKESWEVSAGTITFNGEPNFVVLDVKPDFTEGIAPLTINFMIDSSTAKTVNATVSGYEIDYGDGTVEQSSNTTVTLQDLLAQTFTHTYGIPNTYNPKLTVYIKENTKPFVFNIPQITVGGSGVGGVHLLDNLDSKSYTNQSIESFQIFVSYPNPNDPKNSLSIELKDENGNITQTELDPKKDIQTISLSEGKNTYQFIGKDSSEIEWRSEVREIVLDTTKPLLEVILPHGNEILQENKLIISGVIEDENFESVSYRINSLQELQTINNLEIESIDTNKKAFDLVFNEPVSSLELTVKDKAGNEIVEIIEINLGRIITLKQKTKTEQIKIVKNNQPIIQIKQGEPFELIGDIVICDDTQKSQADGQAKLVVNTNSFMVNDYSPNINIGGNILGSGLITTATLGKLDGCRTYANIFESSILNNNDSTNELFNPNTVGNNANLYWPLGTYTITQTLTEDPNNLTLYGTTFENNSLSTTLIYHVEIIRNANVSIKKVEPKNLIYNQENTVTFKLIAQDSIPFTNDRKPLIKQELATIQKPSGTTENNLNLSCNLSPNQVFPTRELKHDCALKYTSTEYTKENQPYVLSIPVECPESNGNRPEILATTQLRSDFEIGAKITKPEEFTKIKSNSEETKAEATLSNFPEELKDSLERKFKRLAKYGISLPNSKTNTAIRPISKGANEAVIVKGINPSEDKVEFSTKLNFNLINNELFTQDFLSRDAFGPVYLYTAIGSSNLNDTTFTYSTPQKLILLDKPQINNGGALKKKIDKKTLQETKELRLTVSNNTKLPEKYALKLNIEAYDVGNNLLTTQTKLIKITNEGLNAQTTIKDLPKETEKVKVILNRNDNFLNEIKERVKDEFGEIAANTLTDPDYKITDTKEYIVDGEVLTFCETELENNNVLFNYSQKSGKIPGISAEGTLTTGPTIVPILNLQEIIDPTNRLTSSMSGTISFPLPDEWNNFSSVTFTIKSGGEENTCELEIGKNCSSSSAFVIGDPNDKTATINGKTISVQELKDLLLDIGLLRNEDYLSNGYTNEVNNAYWKLVQVIDEAKGSTLDPNLRLQTAENPLTCTVTYFEGYPDEKYIEDVSAWKEFIEGLKARVGQDISAFVNPTSIGILATFIAWNAILPVNAWILLIAGFAGTSVDVIIRINEIKDLWNNSSNLNYTKTSNWKTGYSIGTLLTAVPGLIPANVAKNVKVAEVAAKLDDYGELQSLILNEQKTVNELVDITIQSHEQGILDNFATIVEKVNQDGKKVLNDVVKRFINRGFDKSLIVKKLGLTSSENKDLLIRIINRDNLAISLNERELNDLVFTIVRAVEEQRLNQVVYKVTSNIIEGRINKTMNIGKRILRESAASEVFNGNRTLSNELGTTFLLDIDNLNDVSNIELVRLLGYDNLFDLNRFIGEKIYIFEVPLGQLDVKVPVEGNINFVKGGITSGGAFEFIVENSWLSQKLSRQELEALGVIIQERPALLLREVEVRSLLENSLYPPSIEEINQLITSLKELGKL